MKKNSKEIILKSTPSPKLIVYCIGVIFSSSLLTGCAAKIRQDPGYFIVESSISQSNQRIIDAEVTPTTKYQSIASKVKTVALRAPSSCDNETLLKTTEASRRDAVVRTICGVEMAELERALIQNGYTVLSWNMVNNAVKNDTKSDGDVTKITKKLGAQILFQVNSLDKISANPAKDARITRDFFTSDGDGFPKDPKVFSEARIATVVPLVSNMDRRYLEKARVQGAMLDINAVDAETGQTIWFYRGQLIGSRSSEDNLKSQIYCYNDHNCYLSPPEKPKQKIEKDEDYSTRGSLGNLAETGHYSLIRQLTQDFAKRFAESK